jgi:hypothetical protein
MTMTWAMANAVATAVIWSIEAPIEPRMSGSATLTIELSIVAMIAPKLTAKATSHLLSGRRRPSAPAPARARPSSVVVVEASSCQARVSTPRSPSSRR